MHPTTVITSYHFKADNAESYQRLLRSVRASLQNLGGTGRIILVANGKKEAEDPERVIEELGETSTQLIPVQIPINKDIAGALNAGIERALSMSPGEGEWIANVQSSDSLEAGWLENVAEATENPTVGAAFGQLLCEEHRDKIWANGHYLKKGRGDNNKTMSDALKLFPCFSTCIIRRKLIEQIVNVYGSLVTDHAPHYCDCPDFAFRAKAVFPNTEFRLLPKAVAYKRQPKINWRKLMCSRLVSAEWYYHGRKLDAEASVKKQMEKRDIGCSFSQIRNDADAILRMPYSRTNQPAPKATKCMDKDWSATPCGNPDCAACST